MKALKILKVFLSILLIVSLNCCKDPISLNGDIVGVVTHAGTSDPLDSVSIQLNQDTYIIDETKTENDGSFELLNIEPGSYEITAIKPGYSEESKSIEVESGVQNQSDFALSLVPYIKVTEKFLDFGIDSIIKSFTIKNVGEGTLQYVCNSSVDWIDIEPTSGEVTTETDIVTVTINRAALNDGIYKDFIKIISFSGDVENRDTVDIYVNGVMGLMEEQYYSVVRIGTQTWMAENLNTGTMKDFTGTLVLSDNDEIEKYCYENAENNCDIYGGLYSWDEAMNYVSFEEGVYDEQFATYQYYSQQGICPDGWHIPSLDDWFILYYFAGGNTSGSSLKADSPLWEGDTIKTDEFGFSALPGGNIWYHSYFNDEVDFWGKGYSSGFIMANTDPDFILGGTFAIMENILDTYLTGMDRSYATAVRCIKDE